jgi:hypothetical protein
MRAIGLRENPAEDPFVPGPLDGDGRGPKMGTVTGRAG